jgi:hypothetical protein
VVVVAMFPRIECLMEKLAKLDLMLLSENQLQEGVELSY